MDWAITPSLFGASIFLVIGFVTGWIIIRRGRKPVARGDALIQWSEITVPTWKQDPVTAAFMVLHTAVVLYIAALFLADLIRHAQPQILPSLAPGGMALVAFICGMLLSFPFATAFTQPAPMAILPDGVAHGQIFSPWNAFSHFNADAKTRIIRLFAARAPELARVTWQPPTPELYGLAAAILRKFLPQDPPAAAIPVHRRWYGFLSALGGATIPFILAASIVYILAVGWSWVVYTFSVYLVAFLGERIIRRYQVG